MRYLKAYRHHMKERAELLTQDIVTIEGPLREVVAYMAEALAQNAGHFWAKHMTSGVNGVGVGMEIFHIDIDEDLMDAYEARFGEELLEEAAKWLLERLHGESSIFVAWALGPIRFQEENHCTVLQDRILFDLVKREFQAVVSHQSFSHPDCKHYMINGGTRKGLVPYG